MLHLKKSSINFKSIWKILLKEQEKKKSLLFFPWSIFCHLFASQTPTWRLALKQKTIYLFLCSIFFFWLLFFQRLIYWHLHFFLLSFAYLKCTRMYVTLQYVRTTNGYFTHLTRRLSALWILINTSKRKHPSLASRICKGYQHRIQWLCCQQQ